MNNIGSKIGYVASVFAFNMVVTAVFYAPAVLMDSPHAWLAAVGGSIYGWHIVFSHK